MAVEKWVRVKYDPQLGSDVERGGYSALVIGETPAYYVLAVKPGVTYRVDRERCRYVEAADA